MFSNGTRLDFVCYNEKKDNKRGIMAKIEDFVMQYYRLENDIFFNQVHDTGEAVFTFSENIVNSFWNHAYPYNILSGGGGRRLKV